MCWVWWDTVVGEVPLAGMGEGYASVTELWLVECWGGRFLTGRQPGASHVTRGLEKCLVLQGLLRHLAAPDGMCHACLSPPCRMHCSRQGPASLIVTVQSPGSLAFSSPLLPHQGKSGPFPEARRKEFYDLIDSSQFPPASKIGLLMLVLVPALQCCPVS